LLRDRDKLPSSNVEQRHALIREKLTKSLLLSLPSGAFIVSNCFRPPQSVFSEQLGRPETRIGAWQRAVEARADGRLCQVVWTQSDFIKASFVPWHQPGRTDGGGPDDFRRW
jgi:hypothetical protein